MSALERAHAGGVVRSRLAPLLALAGAAGLVAVLFAYGCERRTEVVHGFRGAAEQDRFLAAERLLEAMGAEVRHIREVVELDALPPPDGAIFMTLNRRAVLTRARSDALRDWVERGGHLVVETWEIWDDESRGDDYLLDGLGVKQYMRDPDPRDDAEDVEEEKESELAQVHFDDRAEPLRAEFDPRFYITLPDDLRRPLVIRDANGVHVATLALGDGYLTVLTDDYFLANHAIRKLDHAELTWRLARLGGREGPVWLVRRLNTPTWGRLAWRHAWMVLASLGALTAFWLWSASGRSGPLRPDTPLDRRRLMEHVEATGRFLARRGSQEALAQGVRDALMARIRTRHPTWVNLDPAELARRLADLSELDRERVERALGSAREWSRDQFATHIATLETIRQTL